MIPSPQPLPHPVLPVVSSPSPARVRLPSDRDASGRDLGAEELRELARVIESGTLICTSGRAVKEFEAAFAATVGRTHAVACSSGSAAVHAALAAVGLQPGDEVVSSPITDMGAILPILYEGGLPRFCDVDPVTMAVTPQTVAAAITPRTRAIVVTHLFGMPCDGAGLARLAAARGVTLIEDCAQAFLASTPTGMVGSFGSAGCYSFQQGKHLTTGEGGIVTTSDASVADRVRRVVNKGWGYGDANPDHDRPGLNYRLTELQGAVALAQLRKLDGCVARRRARAAQLTEALRGLPGVVAMAEPAGHHCAYWRYLLHIDPAVHPGGPHAVAAALKEHGIASQPGYVGRPAYACAVFQRWRDHTVMRMPVQCAGLAIAPWENLGTAAHPGVFKGLGSALVLPWNEALTVEHVDFLAASLRAALRL